MYLWSFLSYNATSSLLISKLLAYSCIEQDKPCSYERNSETRSCDHCCHGKTLSITHSECVCMELINQHAMRMRHIVIW
jgi:hypothetical protein